MTWGVDLKSSGDSSVIGDTKVDGVDPGKRAKTDVGSYTGDNYVDHGPACDGAVGNGDCFLPPAVRERQIRKLENRISDLGNMVQRACDVVKLKRLMAPTAQPNFVVGLIFDVLTARLSSSLIAEFSAVRTAALQTAHSLELGVTEFGGLKNKLLALEPAVVAAKLAVAVGKAKAVMVASPGSISATIVQAFINELKTSAAIGFTSLRETFPGTATDSEAIALTEALAPERHPQDAFEGLINDKIDRYLDSGVAQIGRGSDTSRQSRGSRVDDGDPWAGMDVRVAWAKYASGYPPQLVFEHSTSRIDPFDKPGDKLEFGARGGGAERGLPGQKSWQRVPPEFAELAIHRHVAIWNTPPVFVDVDDMNWMDSPTRMQMAYKKRMSLDQRVPAGGANAGPIAHTVIEPSQPAASQDWTQPDRGGQ